MRATDPTRGAATGVVEAVAASPRHSMAKRPQLLLELVAGHGIEGDVHAGPTVRHRFDARARPAQPNLRQVHLLDAERLEVLASRGFAVAVGAVGENVLTRGLDLVALPRGTRLHLGASAVVELTGRRRPCRQLEGVAPGLMAASLEPGPDGRPTSRIGVLAVVLAGGGVQAGDPIRVSLPEGRPEALPEL
jgi:MOSC domain-containing protein YiiM